MRILLRAVYSAVVLVVVAVVMLFWRLSRGPISLDFLTPRIQAAARQINPALPLTIGSTQLLWDRERHDVEVSATDVRIGEGTQLLEVPRVAWTFEVSALLRGELAIASIDLVGPQLHLARETDGRISLAGAAESGGGDLLSGFSSTGSNAASSIAVREIGIRDGSLSLEDRASGQTWSLTDLELSVRPSADQFAVEAQAQVDLSPLLGESSVPGADNSGLAQVKVSALYQRSAGDLDIREADVTLADAAVHAKAQVSGLAGSRWKGSADASVPVFPVDALPRYWPPTAAVAAREWVTTNITGGRTKNAVVHVELSGESRQGVRLGVLRGSLAFEGLSVRYLDTMPPVTNVNGGATLTPDGAMFNVSSGTLLDVAVSQATVNIPIGGEPRIAIDAAVQGPLTTVVSALDSPPVELTKAIGMKPRAGSVEGRIAFAFPLRGGLSLNDLGLVASANARDAAVDGVVGDLSARDAGFSFSIHGSSVNLSGAGRLNDIPLQIDLDETVGAPADGRIRVKGDVDANGWKALGVEEFGAWLDGPSTVTALITTPKRGDVLVDASADLTKAKVVPPVTALEKPVGVPGNAKGRLRFSNGAIVEIDQVEVGYQDSSLQGSASRASSGRWTLKAGATFAARSGAAAPGQVNLDVSPSGDFRLVSPDFGAVVQSLGRGYARGGDFLLHGTVALEKGLPFDGNMQINGVTVVNEPVLVKLLTLASVRGLLDSVTGQGVNFDEVKAKLSQRNEALQISEGVAHSVSATLACDGTIDFANSSLKVNGQLIPSYFGINEGVSKIPLLGRFLTGNQGQAIQSFDFTANGPIDSPDVKVNTLSSITPRALQDLIHRLER